MLDYEDNSVYYTPMFQIILMGIRDVIYLFGALFLALLSRKGSLSNLETSFWNHVYVFIPILCISILCFIIYGLYDGHILYKRRKLLQHIVVASIWSILAGLIWFYLFPQDGGMEPKTILLLYTLYGIVGLVLSRFKYIYINFNSNKTRSYQFKLVTLGESPESKELHDSLKSQVWSGYKAFEYFNVLNFIKDGELDIVAIEEFKQYIHENQIQYLVFDSQSEWAKQIAQQLYPLLFSGVRIISFQDMYERLYDRESLAYIDEQWFLDHISGKTDYVYQILKRVMDIVIAFPIWIVSLVFYPFVYLAIKIEDQGDIFLTQDRIGQNNKIIKIIKFRSMRGADDGTWVLKEGQDAEKGANEKRQMRVTKVGSFIRKTRIDELPQLWNVIRGDLSLIGPRPELPEMVKHYEKEIPFYSVRHMIRPGLSGWAQIHHEVPPHSVEGTKEKLSYDLYYIKHRSIFLDMLIALRTIQTLASVVGV